MSFYSRMALRMMRINWVNMLKSQRGKRTPESLRTASAMAVVQKSPHPGVSLVRKVGHKPSVIPH